MKKSGWDEDQKDHFTVTNILSTIILLGASWATCSTWFNGPFVFPCAGVVWIALTLIFFKHPVSAFVIAISMVVAVIAYPQALSPSLPPIPTLPDTPHQYTPQRHEYSQQPSYPQQSDTKQTQKEWPSEPPPRKEKEEYKHDEPKYSEPKYEAPAPVPIQYKEPEPISRDDIILGPGVEVARGSKPTITLSGGGMICEGEEPKIAILFTMTGKGPWQFSYYLEGSDDVHFTTSSTPTHKVYVNKPGVYKLSKRGEDAVCELYDVQGEAVVTLQKKPTIEFGTSNAEFCEGETGKLEAILHGTAPWTVTYNDGEKDFTQVITSSPMKWQSRKPVTYTITALADKYCKNTDLHARASINILPLPSISLSEGKCYGDDIIIHAKGTPPFTIELDNPQRAFTLPDHTLAYPTRDLSSDPSPSRDHARVDRLMFRLLRDAKCAVSTSVIFAELHELPTVSFKETSKIVKTGEKAPLEIVLTGTPPWDLWYTSPSGLKSSRIKQSPYTLLHHEEGKYTLLNVSDTYCKNAANPGKSELEIFTFSPPSVSVSSINTLCEGSTAHVNIDFVGKPPFTYHYSFGGQRFTKTTSSPRATFSTTEPGHFRLDEFSDFFNYTVRPEAQVVREVKFVKPPTFAMDAPAYSCDNAEVGVTISINGQAPFSVQYMLNQTSHTKRDIEERFTIPIPTPTLVTLSQVRDRFGCDASIRPDKETVHVPSKSLPFMEVLGGDCAPITLRFQGVPPFKVDYTFSGLPNQDKVTKSGEFTEYSVQFTEAGAYQFLAISDSYCKRQFTSNLRTILQTPTAELDLVRTHFKVCEIEPKSPEDNKLEIKFTGTPPFAVTILTPDGATELHDITTKSVSIPVNKGGEYEIQKVTDASCRGVVVEEKSKKLVVMEYHTTPTVTISGGGEICQADMLDLQFDMTGTGPWNVECSNGQHTFSFESKTRSYTHHLQTSEYTAPQEKSGTYRITSISDSNCKGIPGTSSTDVVIHPIPTARIQGGGVVCQGEETVLKISLTGTPPWSLSISRNTSDHKIPMKGITQSEIEVKTDEPGFFYIDFIQDAHCKYKRMSVPVYRG